MDTLEILEDKINKAVTLIDKLATENEELTKENDQLKINLSAAEKTNQEKSEKVKDKLSNILDKLGKLDQI